MANEPVLPVVQGDWVARGRYGRTEIARVRQAYMEDDKVYMDLVPYDDNGQNLGRVSPALDGPKAFEPFCLYTDNGWERIEKPNFPVEMKHCNRPSDEPGKVILDTTYFHKRGLAGKPIRTKVRKQSGDYPRGRVKIVYVPAEPSNKVEIDIAGMRRAAQELRTQARFLGGVAALALHTRADALDAEASKLTE